MVLNRGGQKDSIRDLTVPLESGGDSLGQVDQ